MALATLVLTRALTKSWRKSLTVNQSKTETKYEVINLASSVVCKI